MNHYGIHQKNTFGSSQEDMRRSVSVSASFDNCEPVICPKPRRVSLGFGQITMNEPVRPLRWQMCHPSEGQESKAGSDLLDIIFAKPDQHNAPIASSPLFFSGSPPSRVSNPLTKDARFRNDNVSLISPRSMISNPLSPPEETEDATDPVLVTNRRSRLRGLIVLTGIIGAIVVFQLWLESNPNSSST